MKVQQKTTKRTKTTSAPKQTATPAVPALPPFRIDPAAITGTCDTGDVLENVLDELEALLALLAENDWHAPSVCNALNMAHRKAEAARRLYDNLGAWKDGAA